MALSTRSTEEQTELDPTRARQGRLGRPVLIVLLTAIALVVIGFAITWAAHAPGLSGSGAQTSVNGSSFNAPEPAPKNPQPYQNAASPAASPAANPVRR